LSGISLKDYKGEMSDDMVLLGTIPGFSTVMTVSRRPPMKNIEPIMVIRYPIVSLCLDSSAYS